MSDILEYNGTCNFLTDLLLASRISPEMEHMAMLHNCLDFSLRMEQTGEQWRAKQSKTQLYDMLNGSIPIDIICCGVHIHSSPANLM